MIEFFESIGAYVRTSQEWAKANPDVMNGIGLCILVFSLFALAFSLIIYKIVIRQDRKRWRF